MACKDALLCDKPQAFVPRWQGIPISCLKVARMKTILEQSIYTTACRGSPILQTGHVMLPLLMYNTTEIQMYAGRNMCHTGHFAPFGKEVGYALSTCSTLLKAVLYRTRHLKQLAV